MRQHAIPQNILDIEFKLFTKFTVREFVYMAIGIGFGGIFLYFFTLGQVPGIIAIPVFLVSSGAGLFLGLVDINDQKADIFIRNYAWAITHPTQRVWKNAMIDEKIESIKPEFNVTQGTTDRNSNSQEQNTEIIGSSQGDMQNNQFIEQSTLNEIEQEEKETLEKIDQLARSTFGVAPTQPQSTANPIQQTQPVEQQAQQSVAPPTPSINQTPSNLRIDRNNLPQYTIEMSKPGPYAGNLNFRIVNSQDNPIPQAVLVIKDNQGKILSAFQSDPNGEIYSNKPFPPSTYTLQLQSSSYKFPETTLILDQSSIGAIKIKSL